MTEDSVGETTALSGLLDQIDGDVTRFFADGAYDGEPSSDMLLARFGGDTQIVIPPPKNAILSADAEDSPTLRDQRIASIRTDGSMARQVSSGNNQCSRGETQMGRRKQVIDPKMKARYFRNQHTEAKIGTRILNKTNQTV